MPEILNKAEIAAIQSYNAELNRMKEAALGVKTKLEPDITSARGYVDTAAKYETTFKKFSKKAPEVVKSFGEAIPAIQQKATEFTTNIINPYESALATLSQTPKAVPAPIYAKDTSNIWWTILSAKLRVAGLPETTVKNSESYFKTLAVDLGVDESGLDVLIDYFFYTKEYTTTDGKKLTSPYYTDFGKFNDTLTRPLNPAQLVPLVLGYRDLGARYKISTQYLTDDAITNYLKNDVSIAEFDERLNTAALKAQIADPQYTNALLKLNYINDPSQLTDFFLDPKVGTIEMKNRQKNAAFVTEAVRRVTPQSQLQVDIEFAKQQAARYASQGYTEAQISNLAATGYENVAQALPTGTKLAGMYDKEYVQASQKATPTETATAMATGIQSELQQEEFMNVTSSRLRALKERELRAFQGASGAGTQRSSIAGAF